MQACTDNADVFPPALFAQRVLRREGVTEETRAELDSLADLVAEFFRTDYALVNLVAGEALFVLGRSKGLPITDDPIPSGTTFCVHTVAKKDRLVVPDTRADARFVGSPFVDGRQAAFRFYAGAPMLGDDGRAVGTICVVDTAPRSFSVEEAARLERFARVATGILRRAIEKQAVKEAMRFFERLEAVRSAGPVVGLSERVLDALQSYLDVTAVALVPDRATALPEFVAGDHSAAPRSRAAWESLLARVPLDAAEGGAVVATISPDGERVVPDLSQDPVGRSVVFVVEVAGATGRLGHLFGFCDRSRHLGSLERRCIAHATQMLSAHLTLARAIDDLTRRSASNVTDIEDLILGYHDRVREVEVILENLPAGIFVKNATTGRVVHATPTLGRLLAKSLDEVLCHTVHEIFEPELAAQMEASDAIALAKRGRHEVVREMRVDGRKVYLWTCKIPVFDEAGRPSLIVGITQDVTEMKVTRDKMIHASKLAALGELTVGITHEVKQPLNVINMAADNLRQAILASGVEIPGGMRRLQRIEDQIDRASRIVDQILSVGRQATEIAEDVDVDRVACDALDFMTDLCSRSEIALHPDLGAGGAVVCGDRVQFQQCLINLVANARDAILTKGEGGTIWVGTRRVGETVRLTVEDTGGGVSEDVLPQIFQAFFTTKPAGKGTGLGLAITEQIIRDMGGVITARNGERGMIAEIVIPVTDG